MAVTTIQNPKEIFTAYNPNYFKIIDSGAGAAGYQYVVKLYYRYDSTDDYTLINSFTVYPDSSGYLTFDANNILRNYVRNTYDYDVQGWAYRNSMFQYSIKVYRVTSSIPTEALIKSWDDYYLIDAAVPQYTVDNWDNVLDEKTPQTATTQTNRSISNSINDLELAHTDYYSADFINNIGDYNIHNVAMVLKTDGGDRVYNTKVFPSGDSNVNHKIISAGIGPMNVKNTTWNGTEGDVTGEDLFNTYNFSEYTIYMYDVVGAEYPNVTKEYNVTLCPANVAGAGVKFRNLKGYDRNWLIYKSKFGGWSYLLFNSRKQKDIITNKTTYIQKQPYNATYADRMLTTINNEVEIQHTLTTDWISEEEAKFFEDLYTSPQVFKLTTWTEGAINSENPFTPVQVVDGNYKINYKKDDKLFQYTITVTESVMTNKQLS